MLGQKDLYTRTWACSFYAPQTTKSTSCNPAILQSCRRLCHSPCVCISEDRTRPWPCSFYAPQTMKPAACNPAILSKIACARTLANTGMSKYARRPRGCFSRTFSAQEHHMERACQRPSTRKSLNPNAPEFVPQWPNTTPVANVLKPVLNAPQIYMISMMLQMISFSVA